MTFKKRFLSMVVISGILGVTFSLGFIVQTIQRTPAADHPFIPAGVSSQNLEAVTITSGAQSIEMKKSAGAWVLTALDDTLPVRNSRVEDLLKTLAEMRSLRLVAQSATGWADLKIDDQTATRIDIRAGKQAVSLWFGGQSTDGSEQYVRETDSPAVYAIKAGMAFRLQQDSAYWLDKRLWPEELKTTEVIGVSCRSVKTGLLKIVKESKNGIVSWLSSGGSASVQKDRLASWVQDFLAIEGDDLVSLDGDAMPSGHSISMDISLEMVDGSAMPVSVYATSLKDGKWLMVPRFESRRLSGQGRVLAIAVPEWKLGRAVLGE
jgi:hypothetical protein